MANYQTKCKSTIAYKTKLNIFLFALTMLALFRIGKTDRPPSDVFNHTSVEESRISNNEFAIKSSGSAPIAHSNRKQPLAEEDVDQRPKASQNIITKVGRNNSGSPNRSDQKTKRQQEVDLSVSAYGIDCSKPEHPCKGLSFPECDRKLYQLLRIAYFQAKVTHASETNETRIAVNESSSNIDERPVKDINKLPSVPTESPQKLLDRKKFKRIWQYVTPIIITVGSFGKETLFKCLVSIE